MPHWVDMTHKVRLGLIGTGKVAALHIAGILAHQETLECVALCDVSEANLDSAGAKLGGVPRRYHHWEDMLADLGDGLDAVDITLPHHLHAAAILAAAAAGKHILCEKPMCMTLAEADNIVRAVERAGVTYMSAHNQLFVPAVQEAKRMLDAGTIGTLHYLRTQDCFIARSDGIQGTWRASRDSQGGGVLIDSGYHPSYLLLYLAGAAVAEVRASMSRFHVALEGEDTACVQVRFENGVLGDILSSWAMRRPYGTHQFHLIGDKGELFGTGADLYYLPSGFSEPAKLSLPAPDNLYAATFAAELAHFAECVLAGTRPIHSLADGRAVLELILRATTSANGWEATAPYQQVTP
jgi:predicted dehydrogenase